MNSLDLLNKFEKEFFDIIWLDGDHTNPQVTIDTFSAFHILKKDGIFYVMISFLIKILEILINRKLMKPLNF